MLLCTLMYVCRYSNYAIYITANYLVNCKHILIKIIKNLNKSLHAHSFNPHARNGNTNNSLA